MFGSVNVPGYAGTELDDICRLAQSAQANAGDALARARSLELILNGGETFSGSGAPDTETVGVKGQHYINRETGTEFVCTGATEEGYTWEPWDTADKSTFAAQPKLTGLPGQVVSFDGMGLAYAVRGWSNQNLLDNWYFLDPINQRGVSGTITTKGYFIDRWKLVDGSVTIMDGGLLLNGTMVQILETDPGQEVTASYLTDDGVFPAEYDSESRTFAITAEGALLRAAKLEVGSVQTLTHQDENGGWVLNDPPPNKAMELEKCQRYQVMLYTSTDTGVSRTKNVFIHISLPTTLRAKPAISHSGASIYRGVNKERLAVTDISVAGMNNCGIYAMVTMPESLPDGTACILVFDDGGYMLLDANL